MSIGAVVCLGFFALSLAAPVVLLVWSRSATMFSGKTPSYDGPLRGEAHPPCAEEVGEDGLSPDESVAWDELTRVVWNMPSGKG